MTHLDLFSGIGGFALAARWAGIETVQFVEINPFCQKVLAKNFPGVLIHGDIKTFTYAPHPNGEKYDGGQSDSRHIEDISSRPFLLTGGFPCQPFSCAGKRRGKEDDRYLWPETFRVVAELKPEWIVFENVAGIFSILEPNSISELEAKEIELFQQDENYEVSEIIERIHRRIVGIIITDLEKIGYDFPRSPDGTPILLCLPACAVGAPHRRDRVWIVGNLRRVGCAAGRSSLPGQESGAAFPCNADRHAPDTEKFPPWRLPVGTRTQDSRLIGGTWQEPWIEAATRLCRVDAGVSNRVDRLKSLGNAIVPQVAYEIMRVILEVEREA